MGETLRFDVLGRGDASDLERLAYAVDRLADKLKDLDRADANPKVEVDTRRAERQVGAFADNLQRRIGRAIDSLPDIDLDADASDADREIAEIRGSLAALADKRIGIDVDTEDARAQVVDLERRLRGLSDADIDVSLRADVNAALGELRKATGEVDKLDGRTATVKIDVDRGLGNTIVQIAALGRALQTLAIPAAVIAAAPTLVALGSAAVSASGAVGILPGILAATGAAAAGLVVGLNGVGDALKNLDDAKKFGEALKELAPAAREFAVSVRDIAPAWKSVRLDTQQALFAGLGAEMRKLSDAYLPTMKTGLAGISGQFNLMAKDFVGFATGARTVENVNTIFANTTKALEAARPAAQNLAAAFLDIGVVGSELLPELASGLTNATGRFRTFIDQARRSGELKQWIQGGIDTLKTLGSIAGNVGSTMLSVFAAQRAAGAELLTTLDQLTERMAAWAKSAEGQRTMIAIFQEIRAVIDAVQPGLAALGQAVMQAMAAFANTGGLRAAGEAFSALATAIAPLIPALATLAGGALSTLSGALSGVASVVGPVVSAFVSLLGALGPVGPAVLAVVVAFRLLAPLGATVAGLGVALGGLAAKAGASESSVSRLATVFRGLGTALPIAGAALVAIMALYDQVASKAAESAKAVADGSMTMQQAITQEVAQLQNRNDAYRAANVEGQELASAQRDVSAATTGVATDQQLLAEATRAVEGAYQEYRSTLSPFAQLQADVARATGELNDAVAQFGASSPQAAAAADRLRAADEALGAAQEGAADAAKTHAEAIDELSGAMQSQIGSALAYEEAVSRTADAHKEADEALKKSGANSEAYTSAVLDLAQAHEQQAQAAARAVESQLQGADASTVASAKLQAYNLELLKLNDGTASGQAAFVKLASGLSQTGLDALSATAKMTGLKTEILTLPDGRTVTVVTSADTAQIDSYKAQLNALVAQQWTSTITFVGDPTRVNDTLQQTIQFANGQQATLTLNANNQPVLLTVGQTKYHVDATTGVMTIDGNPAPGDANLNGFRLRVDGTTGKVTIEAVTTPADAARTEVQQPTESQHTIEPQTGPVDAAKTGATTPTGNPHTVGEPVTDNTTGPKTGASAPTGNPHTVGEPTTDNTAGPKAGAAAPTGNPHTVGEPVTDNTVGPKSVAAGPTGNPHTVGSPVTDLVTPAKATASQPSESLHTIKADDRAVVDAKARAVQPTSSMHTINVNDSAVRTAKTNAQRATSSTHTINVRVVGAPIPRAAGAYAVPRAAGAYAAPMAAGGMRRMSAARAEIVPARQPRIIGDRMHGPEAFIPINDSPRSLSILNTAANQMGYEVHKRAGAGQQAAAGIRATMHTNVSQRASSPVRLDDSRLLSELGELNGVSGDQLSVLGRVVAEVQLLRRDLGTRPMASSADRAQRARTSGALGMHA